MPSSSNPLHHRAVGRADSSPAIISGINTLRQAREAGGIDLEELPVGAVLQIETGHTTYRLENRGDGNALLSGHPKYCPQPAEVQIQGSLNASGELQWRYLGKGMRMVFVPPEHGVVRTSSIRRVHRVGEPGSN